LLQIAQANNIFLVFKTLQKFRLFELEDRFLFYTESGPVRDNVISVITMNLNSICCSILIAQNTYLDGCIN